MSYNVELDITFKIKEKKIYVSVLVFPPEGIFMYDLQSKKTQIYCDPFFSQIRHKKLCFSYLL